MIRLTLLEDTIGKELERLQQMAGATELARTALMIARVIRKAGDDAFAVSGAPYAPWAPRKNGAGEHRLLQLSGALRKSLVARAVGSGATVTSDRPYARAHQFGNDPYTIRAKTKRGLFWPGAKHPVASVRHPGQVARPFLPLDQSGTVNDVVQDKIYKAILRRVDSLRKARLSELDPT